MTVYYFALCHVCEPLLPVTFTHADKRDEWALAHLAETGHYVTTTSSNPPETET